MTKQNKNRIDPTARGDMGADLLRRWYEANRETWWQRRFGVHAKHPETADNLMLGLLNEARRIRSLTDDQLRAEY